MSVEPAAISTHISISSNDGLRQFAEQMRGKPVLAMDTEFQRTDTFYPQPGLLQMSDGTHNYIIDPLAIDDFSPLAEIFSDLTIVKLLHACSEDILLLYMLCGELPRPLFDTQIAAALVGHGTSVGYSNLVKKLLNVALEKEETRSDWLKRPLTDAQIHYALLDVAYLPAMYHLLVTRLEQLGREQWLAEECQRVLDECKSFEHYEDYYIKVKAAWKLNRLGLGILKSLCYWREEEARRRNKPRNHVVKEKTLWEVAYKKPRDVRSLQAVTSISQHTCRRYGSLLVEHVLETSTLKEHELPDLLPKALPAKCGDLIKFLKAVVGDIANQYHLPPEILMKKHEYNELIRSGRDTGIYVMPDTLTSWRRQIVEPVLLAKLNERD